MDAQMHRPRESQTDKPSKLVKPASIRHLLKLLILNLSILVEIGPYADIITYFRPLGLLRFFSKNV